MVQSNRETADPVNDTNADNEAWKVAAANRKYRIYDGKVWSGGAGMLFSLDPLPGFGSLPAGLQPLVFQSVAQFVTNRVGQQAEGDVQAAVSKCLTDGTMPSANTNDAFERHYQQAVAARVNEMRPLPDGADAAAKAQHDKIIAATAIAARGGKEDGEEGRFADFREAGIAASRNKPITEKKRTPRTAVDTSAALTI